MIAYLSTLPTPLLSSGEGGSQVTSKRIDFDYRSRVLRIPAKRLEMNVKFSLSDTELDDFKTNFYDVIATQHNYLFTCDWFINSNDNVGKTLRIISEPSISLHSRFRYNVSYNIEVVDFGTLRVDSCPIYPYPTLYPSDTLYPC